MPAALQPHTIDVLTNTPVTLRVLLEALPDDVITTADAGGWSPRDVVAHMIATEASGLAERVTAIRDSDHPELGYIDEQQQLDDSGLRAQPLATLLDSFANSRADSLDLILALADGVLDRGGHHQHVGDVTAAELLNHKAYHDALHIAQIADMVAAGLHVNSGPMQAF